MHESDLSQQFRLITQRLLAPPIDSQTSPILSAGMPHQDTYAQGQWSREDRLKQLKQNLRLTIPDDPNLKSAELLQGDVGVYFVQALEENRLATGAYYGNKLPPHKPRSQPLTKEEAAEERAVERAHWINELHHEGNPGWMDYLHYYKKHPDTKDLFRPSRPCYCSDRSPTLAKPEAIQPINVRSISDKLIL